MEIEHYGGQIKPVGCASLTLEMPSLSKESLHKSNTPESYSGAILRIPHISTAVTRGPT